MTIGERLRVLVPERLRTEEAGVVLVTILIFIVHLRIFTGPTQLEYFPGVIDLPTVALAGDPVECPALRGEPGPGLDRLMGVSEAYYLDQRIGQPVLLVPFYLLFDQAGFRVAFAFWRCVLFLATFLLVRRLTRWRPAAWVAALGLVFNPFLLGIDTLNPNVEASALVGLAWLAALGSRRSMLSAAACGLLTGLLFGVAHGLMAALVIPSVAWLLWRSGERRIRWKLVGSWLAVLVAVFILWKVVYGQLPRGLPSTIHVCAGESVLLDATPEQGGPGGAGFGRPGEEEGARIDLCKEEFGGWHRHELGPLTVTIWGMLNWPFNDQLVRSGGAPFPMLLFIPLLLLHSFGLLFAALALAGLVGGIARAETRSSTLALLLYLVLVGGFLAVQENMGGYKYTFLLWVFLPTAMLGGLGIASVVAGGWKTRVGALGGLAVLILLARLAAGAGFPLDERWVHQFGWKGVADRVAASEREQAEQAQEALTGCNLLPELDVQLLGHQPSMGVSKWGVLLRELGGGVHPSNTRSWLVHEAVQMTPPGSLVVVNPYLEAGAPTLADPDRCVVRAPALKPGYGDQFGHWIKELPGAEGGWYLVDSVPLPVAEQLGGGEALMTNGFNRVLCMGGAECSNP